MIYAGYELDEELLELLAELHEQARTRGDTDEQIALASFRLLQSELMRAGATVQ